MCFVSLAHPSAPLVPAMLAAAESRAPPGRAVLDAYVVGFEIEARLGRADESAALPARLALHVHARHDRRRGGASAGCSGSTPAAAGHALAIAASEASGLKENFGTMVKPLHAGLAARNGVLAALLAQGGHDRERARARRPAGVSARAWTASATELDDAIADLGARWEILDTGITVKLYPSCAGTHPSLDAMLDLRRREGFTADDVERIDIDVDSIVPTILIYDRPATGLEGEVQPAVLRGGGRGRSAASASTRSRPRASTNPAVTALMPRVAMRVDPSLDDGARRSRRRASTSGCATAAC